MYQTYGKSSTIKGGGNDNFPIHLVKQILQFVHGDKIYFNRNSAGKLSEIVGIANDNVVSKTLFEYESERISIYSFCDNQDDELHPSDVSFCNCHIRLPIRNTWSYSTDLTEIVAKDKNVLQYHFSNKIRLNSLGQVVDIVDVKNRASLYHSEYNEDGLLISEEYNGNKIKNEYNNHGCKTSKKVLRGKDLLEEWIYEYDEDAIGPSREYLNINGARILKQINSYIRNYQRGFNIKILPDGIIRKYYTYFGDLIASIHVPKCNHLKKDEYSFENTFENQELFPSIHFTIVDNKSGSAMRVQKEDGIHLVNQTVKYSDGLISKVVNKKDSLNKICQLSHFEKEWWKSTSCKHGHANI